MFVKQEYFCFCPLFTEGDKDGIFDLKDITADSRRLDALAEASIDKDSTGFIVWLGGRHRSLYHILSLVRVCQKHKLDLFICDFAELIMLLPIVKYETCKKCGTRYNAIEGDCPKCGTRPDRTYQEILDKLSTEAKQYF